MAPAEPQAEPHTGPAVDAAALAPLGGALVAARSEGVGGVLDGRYPGVAASADAAAYALGGAGPAPSRLDVRF
jgi:hypothetical protein